MQHRGHDMKKSEEYRNPKVKGKYNIESVAVKILKRLVHELTKD